jgi:DNA-binding NtrC family response regulator
MSRILIVDDEPAIGWSLREMLADAGHTAEVAGSVEEGLEAAERNPPEAMLLDVRLPGRDGLSAVPDFRRLAPSAAIVVMTAFGDLETAVRAVEAGAADYLVKPFDLDRVSAVVTTALASGQACPVAAAGRDGGPLLVGSSPAMQEVFKRIALVAPTGLPVLITGQTGTGKELVARAIHAHGPRADGPFVATSLASLSESVIESELFGHVRGAFTGATADRTGTFELATGGTILLDEIGEASAEVQVKLLRVLEEREIVPVGAGRPRPVDVRVIAATNRDFAAAIAANAFREDLFHRLNAFPIHLPTLAERLDDLPALVERFVASARPSAGGVTDAFLAAARARPWPGNVRELRHAVEHACVMARGGPLQPAHLPPPMERCHETTASAGLPSAARERLLGLLRDAPAGGDLRDRIVTEVERALVAEALLQTGGNRTAAAKLLGIDRATLRARLDGDGSRHVPNRP